MMNRVDYFKAGFNTISNVSFNNGQVVTQLEKIIQYIDNKKEEELNEYFDL